MDWLFHPPALYSFLRRRFCQTRLSGAGISTCCPLSTLFSLDLGPALPWADQPSPGTLGLPVYLILANMSLLMPAFSLLNSPRCLTASLRPVNYAPLPMYLHTSHSFGGMLSPLHFRRRGPRPVSCYALFKGWLLLSQPPGCLGVPTSLSHLACSLGP